MANPLHKTRVALLVGLVMLAVGALGLRFHNDFLAGFGIASGVALVAISTLKSFGIGSAQPKR
jgi:hypothetical protein